MKTELFWLGLTAVMTGLFWLVYVLNRMLVRGVVGAMANPSSDDPAHAPWAERAIKAHNNAVENIVIFGILVLAVVVSQKTSSTTATACAVYFFARLGHFIVYTFGIPVARTLTFAAGWLVQMYLGLVLLGVM